MERRQVVALLQVVFILVAGWGLYDFVQSNDAAASDGELKVVDSNGVEYAFDEPPKRIALTNTYAASVLKLSLIHI